jgi:hypothetical protein
MYQLDDVVKAAKRLYQQKDENSLLVLVGMREKAIGQDVSLIDNPEFEPQYDEGLMGPLDEIKVVGLRILGRWNTELYGLVCGNRGAGDAKIRQAVLNSLSLDEAAVVAAVAGVLLSLTVPAAIAAAVAPLIVKKFIWPAKEELCLSWGEALRAQN